MSRSESSTDSVPLAEYFELLRNEEEDSESSPPHPPRPRKPQTKTSSPDPPRPPSIPANKSRRKTHGRPPCRVQSGRIRPRDPSLPAPPFGDTTKSALTKEELFRIAADYPWPDGTELILPSSDANPHDAFPDGTMVVYEDALKAGFRLPLHPLIKAVLNAHNLCPAQLAINAWRMLAGFLVRCALEWKVSPTLATFQRLFRFQPRDSWYFLASLCGVKVVECARSKTWKKRWFVIRAREFDFGVPTKHGAFCSSPVGNGGSKECKDTKVEARIMSMVLRDKSLPMYYDLLTPRNLELGGLSLLHSEAGMLSINRSLIVAKHTKARKAHAEADSLLVGEGLSGGRVMGEPPSPGLVEQKEHRVASQREEVSGEKRKKVGSVVSPPAKRTGKRPAVEAVARDSPPLHSSKQGGDTSESDSDQSTHSRGPSSPGRLRGSTLKKDLPSDIVIDMVKKFASPLDMDLMSTMSPEFLCRELLSATIRANTLAAGIAARFQVEEELEKEKVEWTKEKRDSKIAGLKESKICHAEHLSRCVSDKEVLMKQLSSKEEEATKMRDSLARLESSVKKLRQEKAEVLENLKVVERERDTALRRKEIGAGGDCTQCGDEFLRTDELKNMIAEEAASGVAMGLEVGKRKFVEWLQSCGHNVIDKRFSFSDDDDCGVEAEQKVTGVDAPSGSASREHVDVKEEAISL